MSPFKLVLASLLLTAGFTFSAAGATLTNASAQGDCDNFNKCSLPTALSRSYAGFSQDIWYRDWFTFSVVPNFTASSATLSIYNLDSNLVSNDANGVFSLYAPTSLTYDGLKGNGVSLGSVTAFSADTGISHYVDIALNADGLNYINSNLGKSITFGGSTTAGYAQFFGYRFTAGKPAILSMSAINPVPEPETYAMLLVGLGLIGATVRRRKGIQV
jgi:hypothetical protein